MRSAKPAGDFEVGTDTGDADNARFPAHARTHKKTVFSGYMLKNLAEVRAQSPSRESGRLREQLLERRALQSPHAQIRQDFLLPDALFKRTQCEGRRPLVSPRFDNGRGFVVVHRKTANLVEM